MLSGLWRKETWRGDVNSQGGVVCEPLDGMARVGITQKAALREDIWENIPDQVTQQGPRVGAHWAYQRIHKKTNLPGPLGGSVR